MSDHEIEAMLELVRIAEAVTMSEKRIEADAVVQGVERVAQP